MVSAPDHKRYIGQIFNEKDPYIDEDAVFGVRSDLVVSFDEQPSASDYARFKHVERPFNVVNMDFVLALTK